MSLKNWNSPFVNIIQAVSFLWDVTMGLSSLHKHEWRVALLLFGVAGFIAATNISSGLAGLRLARLRARHAALIAEHERIAGMTPEEMALANQKARENLKQIARALGAEVDDRIPAGQGVILKIRLGDYLYLIEPGRIYRYSAGSDFYMDGTCLRVNVTLPYDERVASAVLLLKNDPTIYERWMRQDNYYA